MTLRAPCVVGSLTWNWCPKHQSKHIYVQNGYFYCAKCEEDLRANGEETGDK